MRSSTLSLLMCLFLQFSSAWAADYSLPTDIGKKNSPFKDCSRSGQTYSCSNKVDIKKDDTVALTSHVTLNVNKDFKVSSGGSVSNSGFVFDVKVNGKIHIDGSGTTIFNRLTATKEVKIHKGANLTADIISSDSNIIIENKNNTITSNITASGNVEITGGENTINGDIKASGYLTIQKTSTVVYGTCIPSHPQCIGMLNPTITRQTTSDTTPIISGTFTSSIATELTVTVNSLVYTLSSTNSKLTNSNDNSTLNLSDIAALPIDTYEVVATSTDGSDSWSDTTSNELVIEAMPTPVLEYHFDECSYTGLGEDVIDQTSNINGSDFITNTLDNCSAFDGDNVANYSLTLNRLSNPLSAKNLTPISGSGTFTLGEADLQIGKPNDGSRGKIRLTYDTTPTWLQYDWSWSGTDVKVFDENPSAIATFGLFRGNDRIIYMREVFN